MSAASWYYVGNGAQQGPVDIDAVRRLIASGLVKPDTQVWTDGLAAWMPASQTEIASLFAGGSGVAAPPPAYAPAPVYAPAPGFPTRAGAAPFGVDAAGTGYGDMTGGPGQPRSFVEAIKTCLTKYVTFSGRASRSEYWWFTLFGMILSVLAAGIDIAMGQSGGVAALSNLVSLGLLLPSLAAGIRRLHDTDRSGWWYLIAFVPLIGIILLIVWFCQKPPPGQNKFG